MELFLFLDAQNMSRDRTSTLSDRVKEQKFLLGYLVQRGIDIRGRDRVDARFGPPPENRAWSKGLTIPELDFNTLYFMSSFFFFYIYSHIESVDIHSWQIRKNWFQNRNRSLCELCIQGAICEKHTCSCRVLLDTIHISFLYYFFLFLLSFVFPCCLNSPLLFILPLFRSLPFSFPFRSISFFIWTVVHLIGCTGLLGTDNWLANNSSNNIRAYDIQVLIYTLHRYFFCFRF